MQYSAVKMSDFKKYFFNSALNSEKFASSHLRVMEPCAMRYAADDCNAYRQFVNASRGSNMKKTMCALTVLENIPHVQVLGLFPAGPFPANFSQLGLFPSGLFPARSLP